MKIGDKISKTINHGCIWYTILGMHNFGFPPLQNVYFPTPMALSLATAPGRLVSSNLCQQELSKSPWHADNSTVQTAHKWLYVRIEIICVMTWHYMNIKLIDGSNFSLPALCPGRALYHKEEASLGWWAPPHWSPLLREAEAGEGWATF